MGLLLFFTGFFVGGIVGTILMAAANAASKRDILIEKSFSKTL